MSVPEAGTPCPPTLIGPGGGLCWSVSQSKGSLVHLRTSRGRGFVALSYIIAHNRESDDSVLYFIKVISFYFPLSVFFHPAWPFVSGSPYGGSQPCVCCIFILFVWVNTAEYNMFQGFLTKSIIKKTLRHLCSHWRGHDCFIIRVMTVHTVSGHGLLWSNRERNNLVVFKQNYYSGAGWSISGHWKGCPVPTIMCTQVTFRLPFGRYLTLCLLVNNNNHKYPRHLYKTFHGINIVLFKALYMYMYVYL